MKILEIAGSVASISAWVVAIYFQWQGRPDHQRNIALITGGVFLVLVAISYVQRRKSVTKEPSLHRFQSTPTLDEIIGTILYSNREDWNTITTGSLSPDSHMYVASYKPNVSIKLSWGLEIHDDFKEEWANQFPDHHASSHYVDVFFNNSQVFREAYVIVDGGRAYLPLPKNREDLTVPSGYVSFIRLIDGLTGRVSDFDSYFRHAGLRAVETTWP